jgi:two-component system phosphate regulon sensor histidine kinase PhoR
MSEDDVSLEQLKRKLDQLEKQNTELERKIDQVEKERVEYLQNVSHQLVAPLNAIKWHIENLTGGRISYERAKKVLRSVYSQATIVVHLAKNFNLMSNLEADHALAKLKEPLQEIGLRQLLVNLADDFQPLAWENNINIVVDKEHFDDSPAVLAMKPLVSQVFSNIIENAVKYSDSNTNVIIQGKYVSVSDCFSVSIRSRGIPLNPEHVKKVFDRGFRGEEARSKYPAGTGFGLYIARRIVEIHEGEIKASTTSDGWTVFEVVLSVKSLQGKARIREPKDHIVDRR